MGAVTALGNDLPSTWQGVEAGRSGISTIASFDPSRLTSRIAGEVRGFDASALLDRKEQRRMDRYIQMALVVTREAMDRAGLPARLDGNLADRTGAILATGMGGLHTLFENVINYALRGPDRISPFMIPMGIPNMAAGQIAMTFGALGPSFATVSACASSGHAIGEAFETIRRGDADLMIAGGSEAPMHEALVGAFAAMKALSTRNDDPPAASRPFDRGRDGFVIAEGAGVLILEALESAQARGAEILAEISGYGATADGYHLTLPAPGGSGALRAARRALEKAGLGPDSVDHVNAHATSTPEGDPTELEALARLFAGRSQPVTVTANKSMLGHTLGAAGAIEAIVTIQTIRTGCVPPTINLEDPEPVAPMIELVARSARQQDVRVALSNAFGFGGQNTALVFQRWAA
jgi:3-oxoacyl-[acyl-carrier-protein] synthase II